MHARDLYQRKRRLALWLQVRRHSNDNTFPCPDTKTTTGTRNPVIASMRALVEDQQVGDILLAHVCQTARRQLRHVLYEHAELRTPVALRAAMQVLCFAVRQMATALHSMRDLCPSDDRADAACTGRQPMHNPLITHAGNVAVVWPRSQVGTVAAASGPAALSSMYA